ncbi:DUF3348 family protein [Paracidovorax sp. MALMAid1276]|uniref:DUF3348 family protein n=1 Tax=Paracidovorax sp. MALMAid1276 TaxID=3411631 RepID=UPI003B99445F
MYQHHQLHRSRLVLLLQQWSPAPSDAAQPAQDLAEQMSPWLSTVDAVQLSRALHALESAGAAPGPRSGAVDVPALQARLDAARSELAALASAGPASARPVRERADNTPVAPPDPELAADFAVYAARYIAVQKQVESRVAGLRAQMRQVLSAGPEALRRLAALDAVMEHMLGAREQRLWASLTVHLERRMAQLRTAHGQRIAEAGRDDEPHRWAEPGGWLHSFEQDMRALQASELQARLQPLVGLLDAARHHARALNPPDRREPMRTSAKSAKTGTMTMTGTNE